MTHWINKRKVKTQFAQFLAGNGWKLYGWHEDQSDIMTDYFHPASWDGIATKNGYTLVVDAYSGSSGHIPTKQVEVDTGECEHCHGTGDDPSGWTYAKAKENPRQYHDDTNPPGSVSLFPDVISPIPFRDYGALRCKQCHGKGRIIRYETVAQPEKQWPAYQATPSRRVWHIEKDGKILASGTGLWSLYDANAHQPERKTQQQAAFQALLDRIERPMHAPVTAPVGDIQVSPGTKPGYIEIRFPAKPERSVLDQLKAAGFRWARRNSCWYGKEDRNPLTA